MLDTAAPMRREVRTPPVRVGQKSLSGHAVIVGAELARHVAVGRNADKLPNPGQVNREKPVNVRSCRRYIAREILRARCRRRGVVQDRQQPLSVPSPLALPLIA